MSATTKSRTDIRLIIEPVADTAQQIDANELHTVAVDSELCSLDVDTFASTLKLEAQRENCSVHGRALLLEVLGAGAGAELLMQTPGALGVRVNGARPPCITPLVVGDQVQLDDAVVHVTRHRHLEAGPPSEDLVGRRCGVCLVPIATHTTVVQHDCGQVLHLEPESVPEEDRLECALFGCPQCEEPVSLECGLVYQPEF